MEIIRNLGRRFLISYTSFIYPISRSTPEGVSHKKPANDEEKENWYFVTKIVLRILTYFEKKIVLVMKENF